MYLCSPRFQTTHVKSTMVTLNYIKALFQEYPPFNKLYFPKLVVHYEVRHVVSGSSRCALECKWGSPRSEPRYHCPAAPVDQTGNVKPMIGQIIHTPESRVTDEGRGNFSLSPQEPVSVKVASAMLINDSGRVDVHGPNARPLVGVRHC